MAILAPLVEPAVHTQPTLLILMLLQRGGEAFQRRVNEVAIENLARADDSLLERKHTDRLLGSIRSDLDR